MQTTLTIDFNEPDTTTIAVKEMKVEEVPVQAIREVIESNHYSANINGVAAKHCFRLRYEGIVLGGIIYGSMAMANQWKKYADKESDITELRRLACIDDTKKNTESYFIGGTLRWMKKHTKYKRVISYADETHGHTGVVYKATNFKHVGYTKPGKMIRFNGRLYHDKTIRTKYKDKNGEVKLKPYAIEINDALAKGEAEWVETQHKSIYIYNLT